MKATDFLQLVILDSEAIDGLKSMDEHEFAEVIASLCLLAGYSRENAEIVRLAALGNFPV